MAITNQTTTASNLTQYEAFTYLGEGSKLKGEIYLEGLIRLSGEIEGLVKLPEDSALVIEKEGKIKGTVYCHRIEIFGQFDGELFAKESVILQSGSFIKGKIHCNNLIVYPGAILNIDAHTH